MDTASDRDQEYIYFMGSETLPSACYILSEESSIPFTQRVTSIIKRENANMRGSWSVVLLMCMQKQQHKTAQ